MDATILLVEDNEQNRYLATYLLERAGCRVIHAGNGRDALIALDSHAADLVLMDVQMPEMDGFQCLRAIREQPARDSLAVIAVTSYATGSDRQKALEAGFADYLEKPIDPALFVEQIKQFIPQKPGAS